MWRGLILAKALEQFLVDVSWGDLDYLLIDMPPGTGDIQMALSRLLPQTEMLVVTTPAVGAQKVAARVADMARRSYLKVLGVIENMTEFVAPDGSRHAIFGSGGGKRLAALTGAPFVGAVPIEPAVSSDGDAGNAGGARAPRRARGDRVEHDRGADRHRAAAAGRDGRLHGAHVRARPKVGVSAKDPFDAPGRHRRRRRWRSARCGAQRSRGSGRGFDERRFRKALRAYWGPDADSMRMSLAVQDASFVAGVVHMVGESLGLSADDQRRIAAAVIRRRLLGEPVPSLDDVDYAWQAWWPPPPGDEGRMLFADFLGTWREWLASSPAVSGSPSASSAWCSARSPSSTTPSRPSYPGCSVRRRSSSSAVCGRATAPWRSVREPGRRRPGFVARGLDVHALEPSAGDGGGAAGQGRRCGGDALRVVDSTSREQFRLVYGAQAWHWVGGDDRYERVAAALGRAGIVAFFWNKGRDWTGALGAENDAVYARARAAT